MRLSESELQKIIRSNPHIKIRDIPITAKTNAHKVNRIRPVFDSAAEERFYNLRVYPLILSGDILRCELHKTFEIAEAASHCGKKYKNRVYTPDFILEYADGSIEVVEIKGRVIKKLQRDYPLRRQLFILKYCIPNNWRFIEVHDDEI